MFVVAIQTDSLAADFHHEIYPQAEEMVAGRNPYPSPDSDLSGTGNFVWPPLVAFLAAPLTLLPVAVADVVVALGGLASFALALWIVGVRDWRVYGSVALWAPVVSDIRTAHLTLVLCLLAAVAWRARARLLAPGVAIGVAVSLKFLLWPLLLWLAARRNYASAAAGGVIGAASLGLLLPYLGILEYARLLRSVGETFDQDSYSPYGLLAQLGVPDPTARIVALAIAFAVLALAWRRRSFVLFVAAALLFSPIVWLDYYALLAVPLAVALPTFSWVWLLPVLTWGLPGAGFGAGSVEGSLRVLAVFAVLVVCAERAERTMSVSTRSRAALAPS
jgi:hypothetical protein